ncbi:MAG: hypothetical protein OJJ21_16995 [Ferrovibrio sp.]|uniref:hypothetical protein n=1 Tax=Ferrovibrio sp. TaxID=1917215 RepID=UPI00261D1101|nr:hypothetical protein [Ferrovibrio sp.]MCW0235299.1 hypothetical protein [Ferrovibrio sp.]
MATQQNTTPRRGGKVQPAAQIPDDRVFCRGFLFGLLASPDTLDPFTLRQAERAGAALAAGDADAPMAFAVRHWRSRGVNPRGTLGRRMTRISDHLSRDRDRQYYLDRVELRVFEMLAEIGGPYDAA